MHRRAERTASVVLLLAAVGTASATPAHADPGRTTPSTRLTSFRDPRVIESSGLVDRGALLYTNNDSGDGPYVYAVDARTGQTTGVTTYSSGDVTDVEAIAPGRAGTVWVGDIGDNRGGRDDISVYRVRPRGRGDATVQAPRYRLAYPDGPRDAETLLADPRTGRLLVVSKSVFGGTVYRAPRHLDPHGVNRLTPFATVDGLVTDGSFYPDGRHVVLRTYGNATVYTYPDFRPTGTVGLPSQRQGEGISVAADGRVLLSSEGLHSDVLAVRLPASITAAPTRAGRVPAPPAATSAPKPHGLDLPSSAGEWWRVGAVGLVALLLVLGATWVSRIRRPR
ncbi:MAG: hypothetical protein ACXVGT_17640 [Oryzihumus sp.]